MCGNSLVEGDEECDGDNLSSQTCATLSFDDGTLVCDNMCMFDTSGCYSCGDGNVNPGEACDGADLGGQSCIMRGFSGGTLACAPGTCDFDESGCLDHPGDGEVIFSEIMKNPVTVADAAGGEWIELFNTSGTTFDLAGCEIVSASPTFMHTIASALEIAPGDYVTLAQFSIEGPGFAPSYSWMPGALSLPDGVGSVALFCGGPAIDEVSYDAGAEFPSTPGASLSLDPTHLTSAENDVGMNWCSGVDSYNGDFGSPGVENPVCAPIYTIAHCHLESPASSTIDPGDPVTAFGRLTITGLTDLTDGVDSAPEVSAELGFGPDGSSPTTAGWTWSTATATPGWDATAAGAVGQDEYTATVTPNSTPLMQDYAFRFSGDSGASYTYCDLPPGSDNGYAAVDAGQLTVN